MTRSEMPESNRRELQALYREAATDEPGPMLDRSILDAARAELKSAAASNARPVPWWKGWLPATTAIAAVVVGVSLTWRVMDEQERQLREEILTPFRLLLRLRDCGHRKPFSRRTS
jgi:hypothetical protein